MRRAVEQTGIIRYDAKEPVQALEGISKHARRAPDVLWWAVEHLRPPAAKTSPVVSGCCHGRRWWTRAPTTCMLFVLYG